MNDWEDDTYDETWEDHEWSDDDDDSSLVIPCPNCEADVYEDAEQCPVCGEYIIRSSRTWESRPTWWVLLGLIGIVAVVLALALG